MGNRKKQNKVETLTAEPIMARAVGNELDQTEYAAGIHAAESKRKLSDNPFSKRKPEHISRRASWRAGYLDAVAKLKAQKANRPKKTRYKARSGSVVDAHHTRTVTLVRDKQGDERAPGLLQLLLPAQAQIPQRITIRF